MKVTPGVEEAYPFGEFHHIVLKQGQDQLKLDDNIVVKDALPNIEDCFMQLMKTHAT